MQRAAGYDLKDFHDSVRTDFPAIERAPAAPGSDLLQLRGLPPLNAGDGFVDRWFLKSADDSFVFQLQDNLIGFNWRRRSSFGGVTDYPGFEVMKSKFEGCIGQLLHWHHQQGADFPQPLAAEIYYDDIIPLVSDGGERDLRLADVLMCWRNMGPDTPGMYGWNAAWVEAITDVAPPDGPMMRVMAMSGGMIESDGASIKNVLRLQFTASSVSSNWDEIFAFLQAGHDYIRRRFSELITPEIMRTWA